MKIEQEFYEHKFTDSHPWKWYYYLFFPFHLGLYKSYWLQQNIKKGAKVLDIGCGGGREYFARHYIMTGVDISQYAVDNAKKVYQNALVGDIRQLPFADESFDFVMSMDLLGHIPIQDKDQTLAEIYRVLKPAGITIHYIETRRLNNDLEKKYPELYHENFIMKDGHFGMETPTETIQRFIRKFEIVKYKGHASTLSPIEDYCKRFDNEMKNTNHWIQTLTFISKLLEGHNYARFLVNCLLGIPARFLNSLAPLDNSSGVFVMARKK